ncbi:hypothetical protein [Bacillus sp. JCM 19041]|uniref:hypothetical protein n=1 Tax=Bacillus sp. JCM 19041 TaxID=1460637 RepID=UPI0006D23E0A
MCHIPFKKISLILLTLLILPASICIAAEKQAAIIIDDFGGNVKGVESFLEGRFLLQLRSCPF